MPRVVKVLLCLGIGALFLFASYRFAISRGVAMQVGL
ncbi:MAG: hypothetical protein QOH81_1078 [Sphingomonadales bacterium]|jgi:hypothetical protein|nr:hypothetical protein [Sphingomonadales bacterium]